MSSRGEANFKRWLDKGRRSPKVRQQNTPKWICFAHRFYFKTSKGQSGLINAILQSTLQGKGAEIHRSWTSRAACVGQKACCHRSTLTNNCTEGKWQKRVVRKMKGNVKREFNPAYLLRCHDGERVSWLITGVRLWGDKMVENHHIFCALRSHFKRSRDIWMHLLVSAVLELVTVSACVMTGEGVHFHPSPFFCSCSLFLVSLLRWLIVPRLLLPLCIVWSRRSVWFLVFSPTVGKHEGLMSADAASVGALCKKKKTKKMLSGNFLRS